MFLLYRLNKKYVITVGNRDKIRLRNYLQLATLSFLKTYFYANSDQNCRTETLREILYPIPRPKPMNLVV